MLLQPLGSGLGADLGHAGHVVHGVAHQGLVVDHQRRRHAELGRHAGHVAPLAVHGVNDGHMLIDQLAQVLVAAGDDDVDALGRRGLRQGRNHVIGLDAGHGHHLPAQHSHHLVDGFDLAAQVVGHGRARGLVLGVHLVAEGRARGIEHADGVIGLHILPQRLHHVHHAADGARGRAGRVTGNRPQIGHGMVGAVEVAGAVHQHQGLGIAHTPDCARLPGSPELAIKD